MKDSSQNKSDEVAEKFGDRNNRWVSVKVSMPEAVYNLMEKIRLQRGYPSTSSMILRCCEDYLWRIRGGQA